MLLQNKIRNFLFTSDLYLKIVIVLTLAVLTYTMLITAWIGDDAQITFRQIWNFISGDGITFNYNERVQAFTHPLWFMALSLIGFLTRELFVTTIFVSVALALSSVIILIKIESALRKKKSHCRNTSTFLDF